MKCFFRNRGIYFHNLAKRDFSVGFIFVIGFLHKKFPKLNFAILVQNRKNKLRKKSFCRNFFHKNVFP